MACDWIKMRTDLYRNPKVCVMADLLMSADGELARYVDQHKQRAMTVTRNVMRNVTVGALVSIWGVMRTQGKPIGEDLFCSHATISVLDDISELPGFGAAMAHIGWVVESADGLTFPRFFSDHNVDPEEAAKKKNAERQARFRDRQKPTDPPESNVTNNVTVTHREEKRREEKKDISEDSGFASFWSAFPNKKAKADAIKAWSKLKPSEALQASILKALEIQGQGEDWTKEGGRFIPHPATWINARRWEDEDTSTTAASERFAGAV